jgi:hypothetical protein
MPSKKRAKGKSRKVGKKLSKGKLEHMEVPKLAVKAY